MINDFSNGKISFEEISQSIWNNGNILMFPINDEDRNELEDKFRYYPDIENEDFYITEIEDISTEHKKRFKAIVYLKKTKRSWNVKKVVNEIVRRLRTLENYGFSSNKVKHGKMNADLFYFVLYKKEVRRGKNRALLPGNDNFIVQIQYDVDMQFPIYNNFINKYLKKCRKKNNRI